MTDLPTVELFVLKCAVLKTELDKASGKVPLGSQSAITPLLAQVAHHVRINAEKMAEYYKIFYLLENDIRELIDDTMSEAHGPDWWNSKAPASAKDECKLNQKREREAGVTSRSVRELDYISFGQLGDIIRANYADFGGILSNEGAMGRVMHALNLLRAPIAHCGVLAEDEVDRLELAVKDWFRLLEGPK